MHINPFVDIYIYIYIYTCNHLTFFKIFSNFAQIFKSNFDYTFLIAYIYISHLHIYINVFGIGTVLALTKEIHH